jgi:adenine-specific DNA methylase
MSKLCSVLLILFTSIICLTACDSSQKSEAQSTPTLKLNANNIDSFTERMAKHYLSTQQALVDAYSAAKKAHDPQSFIDYRNQQWTEQYIVEKDRYAAIYQSNKALITDHSSATLFLLYEDLIYIGLDLKNGLIENDDERQNNALKAAHQAALAASKLANIPITNSKEPKASGSGIMIQN